MKKIVFLSLAAGFSFLSCNMLFAQNAQLTTGIYKHGHQVGVTSDSTRYYFSKDHRSWNELYGMDLSDYMVRNFIFEDFPQLPQFPTERPTYDYLGDTTLYFPEDYNNKYGRIKYKTFVTRDENGRIIEDLTIERTDKEWKDKRRAVYTLDSTDGVILEKIIQKPGNGKWDNDSRELLSRNGSKQVTAFTKYIWSSFSWLETARSIYEYDAKGNCIRQIDQSFQQQQWVNSIKFEMEYNAANQLISLTKYQWSSSQSDWRDYMLGYKLHYEYDVNGVFSKFTNQNNLTFTLEINQAGNYTSALRDSLNKKTITYNAAQKPIERLDEIWNSATNSWGNYYRYVVVRDAADRPESFYRARWDASSNTWDSSINNQITYFLYDTLIPSKINRQTIENKAQVTVYPNPANQLLHININLQENKSGSLSIYTATGKLWRTQSFGGAEQTVRTQIDLSDFPVGIYFLQVHTDKGLIHQKFVVEK